MAGEISHRFGNSNGFELVSTHLLHPYAAGVLDLLAGRTIGIDKLPANLMHDSVVALSRSGKVQRQGVKVRTARPEIFRVVHAINIWPEMVAEPVKQVTHKLLR